MNIAFSTVVLFILLIPGLLFRRFYYTEEFSKEYFKQSFFGTFFLAFIPSLLFHIIGVWVVFTCFNTKVELGTVAGLLSGAVNQGDIQSFQNNTQNILKYNFSLAVFASVVGFLSKKVVRSTKIDRKIKLFRFQNSWHYILTGEFFDFPRAFTKLNKDKVDDIEFKYIDALADTELGTILYEGLFVDYELSSDGGLDYIILKNAKKKFLNSSSHMYSVSSDIKGHILILPFLQIKNLNLSYYRLIKSDEDLTIEEVT